jgi:peroxiredoxin Q/BCP
MMPVEVGQPAPAFRRTAHDGEEIVVGPEGMDRAIVLYFYPKDETPGCTAQACTFRDHYEDFIDAGARVVGVSADEEDRHKSFAEHHRLPFSLLTDRGAELRKRYDVPRTLGLFAGRVTFVIDKGGIVRHMFNSQVRVRTHVAEALRIVKQIAAEDAA